MIRIIHCTQFCLSYATCSILEKVFKSIPKHSEYSSNERSFIFWPTCNCHVQQFLLKCIGICSLTHLNQSRWNVSWSKFWVIAIWSCSMIKENSSKHIRKCWCECTELIILLYGIFLLFLCISSNMVIRCMCTYACKSCILQTFAYCVHSRAHRTQLSICICYAWIGHEGNFYLYFPICRFCRKNL